jgi:hypothetical protein
MDRVRPQRLPRLTPLRVIGGILILGALGLVCGYLLLWGLFSWCTPHFDRSDIVGVYVGKFPWGTETLDLREDGTFLQEVVLREPQDTTPVTRTGTWTFDDPAQTIRISECIPVLGIKPTFGTDFGCAYVPEREHLFYGDIMLAAYSNVEIRKVD